nr:MAG TPA: hypothetical protein [Caudoviricetes sp.]
MATCVKLQTNNQITVIWKFFKFNSILKTVTKIILRRA